MINNMDIISIAQVLVSVILIALILIQERASSGGLGIFGGSGDGGFYQARRGFEKMIFGLTIFMAVAFAGLALLNLVL